MTLRDRLLIAAKSHKDNVEYMRFVVLLKALLLDKTNQQSVNEFNDTVQRLMELQSPEIKKKKKKTPEDVKKIMEDFNIRFPKLKEKAKNLKRAD